MDERRRQKELERKRRKREAKRKAAAALRPLRQRIGEPESWLTPSLVSRLAAPKMSDTLVAFARNALDSLPDDATAAQVETLLLIAMGVWNTVVAGPESTLEDRLRELSRTLQPSSGVPPEHIVRLLRNLAERKRLLFAHDHRLVVNVAVQDEGDQFHVTAVSAPGPS
ncbi:hypothetical protein [Hyalangium sp.]|uniref:hypothetical protein n=1 Tax=Hyalangium sp. TaxID=2028555 RepID=UPI002D3890A3|nr:hypothetical protein [Hyalangium sp.]HYH95361.1 hypothetical protein [Hyalangium sp.]